MYLTKYNSWQVLNMFRHRGAIPREFLSTKEYSLLIMASRCPQQVGV
jgi:hypothetical protein